jgi:hypothetical protein
LPLPLHSRRVTSFMLGDPTRRGEESWLEIGPHSGGVTLVSENFARPRLPPAVLAAMRTEPCFYICVDNLASAIASVPGRPVGASSLSGGMREMCMETVNGMVVLAEVA